MDQLLEPEYQEHYDNWIKDPSHLNTSKLLNAIDPIISSAIRTYGGTRYSPTLKSQAKLMTLKAIQKYDPNRAKLRTHLMTHLQGLRRLGARESQIITIPERVGLDIHHLHIATGELQDKLGREPSTAELSEHTGLPPKRISYVRVAKPGFAESQLTGQFDEGDNTVFNPAITNKQDQYWLEFVYGDLNPTDQVIMEYTLGMHGHRPVSKQKIALKLKLSAGAVSQRAAKIQAMINRKEELGTFI